MVLGDGDKISLTSLLDHFRILASQHLVMRVTDGEADYDIPDVDLKTLIRDVDEKKPLSKQPDDHIKWLVNVDTFNIKIRYKNG